MGNDFPASNWLESRCPPLLRNCSGGSRYIFFNVEVSCHLLTETREQLEETREAVKTLCEPVDSPKEIAHRLSEGPIGRVQAR